MNQNKKTLYENSEQAAILKDIFIWFLTSLDINYPDQPISNYSYLARADADEVSEICRIMSAFGTGITDFQLSDVPIEKALHSLPKNLQDKISAEIEQEQVKIRSNDKLKSVNMILRTPANLYIMSIDRNDGVKCQTIEFCHGKKFPHIYS